MLNFNDRNRILLVTSKVIRELVSVGLDGQNAILVHLEVDSVLDRTCRFGRKATEFELLDELLVLISDALIHLDADVILVVRVGGEVCGLHVW